MSVVPPVVLDRGSRTPLAAQLADALRAAAADGVLRPGDRLPSTRELAAALRVSRTVTSAAYDQLLAEGWAGGRRGIGTFVLGAAPSARALPGPRAGAGPALPQLVELRAGAPCLEVLDRAAWRRAWRAAGDQPPDLHPEPAGDPAFRGAVAEHLLRHRGLVAGPDDVLATAGTSAAVLEVARLLPPGSRVAVEDPGYARAVGALRDAGLEVVPAPVDDDGLVVEALPAGLAAVYCTPAHQFPTGRRMSAARRVALVARARAEGWWVLEDDYDGELRFDVAPLPLLGALGPDVVVHLGTSSKILAPTLGVGWLVAPEPLREALVARRTATGTRPARAGQRVLAALAGSGDLARHLRRLRREMAARREDVRAAVAAAGHRAEGDPAGAHLLVPLADVATERALRAAAAGRGLELDGLGRHHLQDVDGRRAGLVLGYAAPTRAELDRALPVLTELLRTHRGPASG
ncbi:PLP-dependent aminotransferase family protein [Blastococcus sp. TML/M2B]|uniref:MocR-like pyridoxine biosynthesis transcription factor PdxR n=1 Tax=unclassified Blastococcus TaxID=2619396 RepID=UPI00190953E0|nr:MULTISPECIES: PLP-dependent aminotransferase family protein [unclassified Blastococcus]MBN1094035.1 PLP-dependent aminotransferase family protein [Blastococcus sp. TML/M2B]MBN1095848.1 PLP-dependent aminotransferase family protein [Blastococcus sp. TML/C7B]